ncbi:MAG TPA: rhodanese-related sulfurtransferase [Bacteroides sp.]|nr:rhodanese-related sulfurtransferase [Bacteroides sp.]
MLLHNRVNKEELKRKLSEEVFSRKTISLYRYFEIIDPLEYRNDLYKKWSTLNCFGRIYVAHEGINAQMSVPENNLPQFLDQLNEIRGLKDIPIKYAIEDDGKSFYKLTIKVREKIVADGFGKDDYDFTNVGTHLTALEFHQMSEGPDTLVVDMRNHYEYEVGHFLNAHHPNAGTFRDAIRMAADALSEEKEKNVLLYCTGGIRCEKASAYFKHRGFKNVYQLHGGIIEYAQHVKHLEVDSKFTGKNFVFDDRLGESVDGKIIANCHQCGKPSDTHTNCANDDCHQLFIQCEACKSKYGGCCSVECQEYPELKHNHYSKSKIYNRIGLQQESR